jgi:hypothetical protein
MEIAEWRRDGIRAQPTLEMMIPQTAQLDAAGGPGSRPGASVVPSRSVRFFFGREKV